MAVRWDSSLGGGGLGHMIDIGPMRNVFRSGCEVQLATIVCRVVDVLEILTAMVHHVKHNFL